MENLNRVLIPENFDGGTRFPLPLMTEEVFKKTKQAIKNEFNDEGCRVANSLEYAKLYFDDKIIEINRQYVVFIPALTTASAEDIRKRIFKNIANKSYVYQQTSLDNFNLSKRAMLEGDLRVSVSLLYYSLHRAIISKQQRILEDNFSSIINTKEKFEELGHFTDILYYKDYLEFDNILQSYKQLLNNEEEKSKVDTLLCKYSKFGVNPFRITAIIIDQIGLKNLQIFDSVINSLAKTIVSNLEPDKDVETFEIRDIVSDIISKDFDTTKGLNGSINNQEKRVNVAVLKCAYDAWNTEDQNIKFRNYLFAILLRLYWLRQTADYAFDFEVKTSYREISLYIFFCEMFISEIFMSNQSSSSVDYLTKENKNQNSKIVNDIKGLKDTKKDKTDTIIEIVESNIQKSITSLSKNTIYIKAIWQDTNFDFNKLFLSLYSIKGIHTKENSITYTNQLSNFFIRDIYININKDCIILFTINLDGSIIDSFILEEAKILVKNILNELTNQYCKVCCCIQDNMKVLLSNPYYSTNYEECYIENKPYSILDLYRETVKKLEITNLATISILREILLEKDFEVYLRRTKFSFNQNNEYIFAEPSIFINHSIKQVFIFNSRPIVSVSDIYKLRMERKYYNLKAQIKDIPEDYVHNIFDLVMYNNSFLVENGMSRKQFESYIENTYGVVNIDLNFVKNKRTVLPVMLYCDGLKHEYSIEALKENLVYSFNILAYTAVEELKEYNISDKLLKASELIGENVFILATRGLWYFRNENIEYEIRIKHGKENYQKAIELAEKVNFECLDSLIQKYYLENARILLEFEYYEEGLCLLSDPKCCNENGMFIDDVKYFSKLYNIPTNINDEDISKIAITKSEEN